MIAKYIYNSNDVNKIKKEEEIQNQKKSMFAIQRSLRESFISFILILGDPGAVSRFQVRVEEPWIEIDSQHLGLRGCFILSYSKTQVPLPLRAVLSNFRRKKSFLLFFAHQKGLGHMFQKYFSCSPTLFFCVATSQNDFWPDHPFGQRSKV